MKEKRIILIGEADSRRTEFFFKAADRQQEVSVEFCNWSEWKHKDIGGRVVKIDPPSFHEYNILTLSDKIKEYREQLLELEETGQKQGAYFLNRPLGILELLDKVSCKEKLADHHVSVTAMVAKHVRNYDELKGRMLAQKLCSVFLKPVYGSGAAGILALSKNPVNGKVVAYTAACVEGHVLFQQKHIRKITDEKEVERLVNAITSLETIVERWYPKATLEGEPFDFRVVWQFGQLEYMVARKSATPITNLHLNNGAVSLEEVLQNEKLQRLGSFQKQNPGSLQKEIEGICAKAMALFPKVQVAGLDVMLDKKTGKPRIIEINGQGDLLYQDIYGENRIYRNQVDRMAAPAIR